jgi:hypothetical protein
MRVQVNERGKKKEDNGDSDGEKKKISRVAIPTKPDGED